MDYDGEIILVDKPAGITSFGVVARVRRVLSTRYSRKIKVGHTGTLDPFATGLMVLVAGRYTKRAMEFSKLDKDYEATVVIGTSSTTGDPEGELSHVSDKIPVRQEVELALKHFTGEITQTPPAFSAIKINGQRAYKLARNGKKVDIPPRKVTIYDIKLLSYDYPELVIKTSVSSGTYIRSLAEDIGRYLNTGAYVKELRRTRVGDSHLKEAIPLEAFMKNNTTPDAPQTPFTKH